MSETGRLHDQLYFQTKNRNTIKKIKEIFEDQSMSLPNYLVILSIIDYFIDKDSKWYTAVLGLHKLIREYSGENIAEVLL